MAVGIYAANGALNITIVDGTAWTGFYADDGSMNAVMADGSVPVGLNHPCGARWITHDNTNLWGKGFYAFDGSMRVNDIAGTYNGATLVNVISGSFGGGGGNEGMAMGLLLSLTYSS